MWSGQEITIHQYRSLKTVQRNSCEPLQETPLAAWLQRKLLSSRLLPVVHWWRKKQVCEAPLEYLIKGFAAAASASSCPTSNYTRLNLVLDVYGRNVAHFARVQQQFSWKHTQVGLSWSKMLQICTNPSRQLQEEFRLKETDIDWFLMSSCFSLLLISLILTQSKHTHWHLCQPNICNNPSSLEQK